jgi:kinesin family protein 5
MLPLRPLPVNSFTFQLIIDVMKGYNGTLLAYGQTGSGKTHTMMGDIESEEMKGLTPRMVEIIFETIMDAPSNLEFTVKVSFMEVFVAKLTLDLYGTG